MNLFRKQTNKTKTEKKIQQTNKTFVDYFIFPSKEKYSTTFNLCQVQNEKKIVRKNKAKLLWETIWKIAGESVFSPFSFSIILLQILNKAWFDLFFSEMWRFVGIRFSVAENVFHFNTDTEMIMMGGDFLRME